MANSPSVSKSSPPSRSSRPAPGATSRPSAGAPTASGSTNRPGVATSAARTTGTSQTPGLSGGERPPTPSRDKAVLSREAATPSEDVRPGFLDALSSNFGDIDTDQDGHLTEAEIGAGAGNREFGSDARSALGALRDRQGTVEEYSNDEYFDENSGITTNDLGRLDTHPSLDAQRIREEFQANRALLAADPNAEFAPLPDPAARSLGGHALNIARHAGTPFIPGSGSRQLDLAIVDAGGEVDPNSRLGAYQATGGYRDGTVGQAAHNAIGQIYAMGGTIGEDQIGTVFNSPEARALYGDPVDSPSGLRLAEMEYDYWRGQQELGTFGGGLGSSVPPETRDWLQRETFR